MAKSEQILVNLEKLYEKRNVLDKQILETEKRLLSEVKSAKPASAAPRGSKKAGAAMEKPARKPRAPKK
jgi:hypothetical protein